MYVLCDFFCRYFCVADQQEIGEAGNEEQDGEKEEEGEDQDEVL